MKVSLIQMDMRLGEPEYNFAHAKALIESAAEEKPDVICLPETWNVGFFPKEGLEKLSDAAGNRVKKEIGTLAKKLGINIVAGSVANVKSGEVYNTAYVFDRAGACVAEYDKTHLFTPMGEQDYFKKGSHGEVFELDGVKCGIIICYDVRFSELVRTLTLQGIEVLFVPAQWPLVRKKHWQILNTARAIENQCFVACINSCGTAGETKYGGTSAVYDPWGETLVIGGEQEEILIADMDRSVIKNIRESINVYRDRRPELYRVNE